MTISTSPSNSTYYLIFYTTKTVITSYLAIEPFVKNVCFRYGVKIKIGQGVYTVRVSVDVLGAQWPTELSNLLHWTIKMIPNYRRSTTEFSSFLQEIYTKLSSRAYLLDIRVRRSLKSRFWRDCGLRIVSYINAIKYR